MHLHEEFKIHIPSFSEGTNVRSDFSPELCSAWGGRPSMINKQKMWRNYNEEDENLREKRSRLWSLPDEGIYTFS